MTRDDSDFVAYTAARWPFLVRTLELLGASSTEAIALAQTGLARCYSSWDRVRGSDDVDVQVYRSVLACWRRSRGRTGARPAPREPVLDPTDQLVLRWELEDQLTRLDPEVRELLVLRFAADLSELQVADVLEVSVAALVGDLSRALALLDLPALDELTR